MRSARKPSEQTLAVLELLLQHSGSWLYGLEIARETGLKSGTLYPILIRCAERNLLNAKWVEPKELGLPPRHAYQIRSEGMVYLERHRRTGHSNAAVGSPA